MIGEQIENYKIVAMLGEGGMGTVYRAVDVNLDRTVALKLLHAGLSGHPELENRFRAEARAQANLNHPNIATLFAFAIWQGKAVMVMEYIEGQTFLQLIAQHGAIQPTAAVSLIGQALSGVGAAHRSGIVHRDLKPANLMLNKGGVVKVMDFGIAKVEGGAKLTRTNSAIGTLCYMSPEQILGKHVDGRSDIYSMAITLYEMLVGEVPFKFDSEFAIQKAHIESEPPRLTLRNPSVPLAIEAVVLRGLAKNPDNRFANADHFIQALNAAFEIPAVATPAPPPQPVGPSSGTMFEIPTDARSHTPPPHTPAPVYPPPAPPRPHRETVAVPNYGPSPQTPYPAPAYPAPAPMSPYSAQPPRPKKNGVLYGALGTVLVLAGLATAWVLAKPKHVEKTETITTNTPPPNLTPVVRPPVTNLTIKPTPYKPPFEPKPVRPDETVVKLPPNDVPVKPKPEQPHVDPTPVNPPVTSSLAGHWMGTYLDTTTQQTTKVLLQLHQGSGDALSGTVSYTAPDSSTGECPVSSSGYSSQSQNLTLLIHCSGADHPVYFNGPTMFTGVTPTAMMLNHGKVLLKPTISVVLAKTGS